MAVEPQWPNPAAAPGDAKAAPVLPRPSIKAVTRPGVFPPMAAPVKPIGFNGNGASSFFTAPDTMPLSPFTVNGERNTTIAEAYLTTIGKVDAPQAAPEPKSTEQAAPSQSVSQEIPQAAPQAPKKMETLVASRATVIPPRVLAMHVMPNLGILTPLMEDDEVHDILITGMHPIMIDRHGELEDSGLRFERNEDVWKLAETILGQRWDINRPLIDTRLPDGSRVNIVAPPMGVDGVSISIRKFPKIRITLDSMVESGQLSAPVRDFLIAMVRDHLNIVIAGGTGSGKTTLLNALSAAIPPKDRVVTIEDSAELQLQQPHVVRLEAAPSNVIATDSGVGIRELVRNALRMRPDRIIVGEVRGAEAMDMLQAMNTGHDGSMTTLHANAPRDALARLENMVTLANSALPIKVLRSQIANTLHVMIQTSRMKNGQRRITHISEISGLEGEMIMMQDLVLLREDERSGTSEYRWVAGASRNQTIMQAAQEAGLMRSMR